MGVVLENTAKYTANLLCSTRKAPCNELQMHFISSITKSSPMYQVQNSNALYCDILRCACTQLFNNDFAPHREHCSTAYTLPVRPWKAQNLHTRATGKRTWLDIHIIIRDTNSLWPHSKSANLLNSVSQSQGEYDCISKRAS